MSPLFSIHKYPPPVYRLYHILLCMFLQVYGKTCPAIEFLVANKACRNKFAQFITPVCDTGNSGTGSP